MAPSKSNVCLRSSLESRCNHVLLEIPTVTFSSTISADTILDGQDFELELIQRDEINVSYILGLLGDLHETEQRKDAKGKDEADYLGSETQLRSKRDLIEKFMAEYMPNIGASDDVASAFSQYWAAEREAEISAVVYEEKLDKEKFRALIEGYHFSDRVPLRDDVVEALINKPKIRERRKIVERVIAKILRIVSRFDDGIGDIPHE